MAQLPPTGEPRDTTSLETRLGAQPVEDLNEPAALGADSTFAMSTTHARRDYDSRVTSSATADAPPPSESNDARARRVKAPRQKLTSLEKRDGADADAKLRHGFAAAGHAYEYDTPPPGESANARARRVNVLRLKLTSLAKRGGTCGGGQD
ncbi:hypothetical protein T492DRAFT_888057 [Pavlovales sp. CCMP2436]|nr:hypothetical protein T492DRAFT_888057 [Pavlovales sp. CCMP2436]